jgi:hypothetical protein
MQQAGLLLSLRFHPEDGRGMPVPLSSHLCEGSDVSEQPPALVFSPEHARHIPPQDMAAHQLYLLTATFTLPTFQVNISLLSSGLNTSRKIAHMETGAKLAGDFFCLFDPEHTGGTFLRNVG